MSAVNNTDRGTRWRAFARLGKFGLIDHWLPAVIALCAARPDAQGVITLGLTALALVLFASAGAALDDVRGLDDGLDELTYAPDEHRRSYATKPLLSGALDRVAAVRFAAMLVVAGVAVGAVASVVAPYRPWWAYGISAVLALSAVQYSFALSLSYRGLGEPFLAVGAGLTAVVCAGFIAGTIPATLVWLAGATACWMLATVTCSAAADRVEDLSVGRRTMAGRLRPAAIPSVVILAVGTGYAFVVVPAISGVLPIWTLAAFLIAAAVHARQWREARAKHWLDARASGWLAYRCALVAACVLLLSI